MEAELQTLTSNHKPESHSPHEPLSPSAQPHAENGAARDTRPLLKPEALTAVQAPLPNIEELEKKFAAFVRNDVYGPMGRGELPFKEKVLLGIALVILVPLRVVLALAILLLYYVVCRVCTLYSIPNRDEEQEDYAHMVGWRRTVIVRCGKFLSRALLFVLGFYWIKDSHRSTNTNENLGDANECKNLSEEQERPGTVISNHLSYLDILYHMSSSFPSFVAKRSVGKLPLVGLISKCLGCVYVQRESKSSDFKGVSGVVTERVREAHEKKSAPMMMLFPEGTTTNGDFLLPFKTGAFLSKAPVLPVILRYPYQRFSPAWDSISGVRHLIFLLCQFVNHLEVVWLPVYVPSEEEKNDPKLYANNVRRMMANKGNLTLSDIGLAEKRIYHAALNGNSRVMHRKED